MQASKASESEKTNEIFAMEIDKVSKYHIGYIMFSLCRDKVRNNTFKDANVLKVLETLLKIYALKQILIDTSALYEIGFLSQGASKLLNQALDEQLTALRPNMISLVELVDDSSFIKSAAGNHHGDIFESMIEYC